MYGGKTSSKQSDSDDNSKTFIFIYFIAFISVISIVCGGLLIDFYYKNIDDSNNIKYKNDIETLYGYVKVLIGIPITALILIVLWVISKRFIFILIAGICCLVNCIVGGFSISKYIQAKQKKDENEKEKNN
jgi:F0F1-type ATP synthase membrane subunit c/vacuolar-type H+-ATPase subunit K